MKISTLKVWKEQYAYTLISINLRFYFTNNMYLFFISIQATLAQKLSII